MPQARRLLSPFVIFAVILLSLSFDAKAQADVSPELRGKIDKVATDALARSGVPSASIAVVKDGKIVYLNAYDILRFENKTLRAWTYEWPNGKLEQFQIAVQN